MKRNGYRATHRNKWLLLMNKILTLQELALLEYFADQMDFDSRHPQYGTVEVSYKQIAGIFGNSTSSIRQWVKGLLAKGFIFPTGERLCFRLKDFERYIVSSDKFKGRAASVVKDEFDQPVEYLVQSAEKKEQPVEESIQPTEIKSPVSIKKVVPKALGSSKVSNLGSSTVSESKYEMVYREGGYSKLTPDDMLWIEKQLPKVKEKTVENMTDGEIKAALGWPAERLTA